MINHKNKKAIIFGTGSIACRHSRILKDMGYEVHAVTNRPKFKNFDFHNGFSNLININEIRRLDYDLAIICQVTSMHKKTYNLIKNLNNELLIFCEKPAFNDINPNFILHNMRYLDLDFDSLKKPINFTHNADARSWPSKLPYYQRYMFNQSMGGGVYKTNSHEIDLISHYNLIDNSKLNLFKKKSINDMEGNQITVEAELVIDDINVNLSLISDYPIRFWEFENKIIHFYGQLNSSDKEILFVDAKMIDNSYIHMWKSLTRYDFSKQSNFRINYDIFNKL